jgi:hypothetical protein
MDIFYTNKRVSILFLNLILVYILHLTTYPILKMHRTEIAYCCGRKETTVVPGTYRYVPVHTHTRIITVACCNNSTVFVRIERGDNNNNQGILVKEGRYVSVHHDHGRER